MGDELLCSVSGSVAGLEGVVGVFAGCFGGGLGWEGGDGEGDGG